jgi:hypothetical protein
MLTIGPGAAAGVGDVVEEDDDEDPEHPPSIRATRLEAATAALTPRRTGIGSPHTTGCRILALTPGGFGTGAGQMAACSGRRPRCVAVLLRSQAVLRDSHVN